ncbi:MAG: ATP-binding protein, partial [Myxococcota bacterium]
DRLDEADRPAPLAVANPYRGLQRFESDHRALFFGREPDIWRVVELMCERRLVILAGASGVGKSSLVRAGVLPQIVDAGLGRQRRFEVCTIVPGPHPLTAFAQGLARRFGAEISSDSEANDDTIDTSWSLERDIREELERRDWVGLRRRLRQSETGTVLFFDQLDELITLGDHHQAEILAEAMGSLVAERTPGVRVLATVRTDMLAELASLPGLGPLVERAIHVVAPLGPRAMRDVITLPARAAGVRFESEAMIDELVAAVSHSQGGLPLLQFALAQLWESRRDQVISREALTAIGGVEGALARHADQVVDALLPETRAAARAVLLDLITRRGTRTRVARIDLEAGQRGRGEALEALIRGRLVVTGEADGRAVCEIAHEALVISWPRLAGWLEEESGVQALKQRLIRAAQDWHEGGRAGDTLWGRSSLRAVQGLGPDALGSIERAFLAASQRAAIRSRLWAV